MLRFIYPLLLLNCVIGTANAQMQPTVYTGNPKKVFADNENANQYRKNWGTSQLHGRVNSILVFSYVGPAADTITPGYESKEYVHYDATGNLVEDIMEKESAAAIRKTYKYNTDNKWTEMSYSGGNGMNDFDIYHVFDTNGQLIDEGERHPDGTITRRAVSTYDQYGGRTKMTVTGLVTEFVNTYDNDGLLILQQDLINKQPAGKTTWKYDATGHVIEKAAYGKDGTLLMKTNTSFNTFHLPDSISIIKKGYADNIQTFQYDTNGYVISQGYKDTDTNTWQAKWTFSYEFDEQGNWTECIMYDSDQEVALTTIRTITYY